MNPGGIEKRSTVGSAVGIAAVGLVIIAAVAAISLIPGLLKNVILVSIIIGIAIVLICVIIALIAGVISLPMYAYKGETYQSSASYSIDDVKSVSEKKDPEESPKY